MHYHIAKDEPKIRRLSSQKIVGLVFLSIFIILLWQIWIPYAKALAKATAITVLPAEWADSYIASTLPDTELAFNQNQLIIDTPSLKIKAPIVEGVDKASLLKGVGHDPASSLPGYQGRTIISGHRFTVSKSPWATVFFSLDKLKKGDKVKVIYNRKLYTYTVTDSWNVPRNEVYPHLDPTTQPILTLYTCGPTAYSAKNRLGFNAILDEAERQQEAPAEIQTLQEGIL